MEMRASWEVVGVVTEARQLKSNKPGSTWIGFVAKIASIGATFEVQLTEELFKTCGAGHPVHVSGRFETRSFATSEGRASTSLQLVATSVKKAA